MARPSGGAEGAVDSLPDFEGGEEPKMRFAYMVDAQEGLTYARMRELAQAAEAAGFESFVRSDHWLSLVGNWTAHATDAWTTLAALARDTRRIRLGTMVSPVTFREPIALARTVATVDEISGGRVELGLGAGWYAPEHERFGLDFPPTGERFEMLEEQLAILTGLWTEPIFNYGGRHYRLHEAICEPKPVQKPHPPIVLGGAGKPRLLRLAAIYGDELNLDNPTVDACRAIFEDLDAACRAINREPGTIRRSVMLAWDGSEATMPLSEQRRLFSTYAIAGADRIVLDAWPGPMTLHQIELFGREVLAAYR
jgi:F420-dependent oxidoreductase-like protein